MAQHRSIYIYSGDMKYICNKYALDPCILPLSYLNLNRQRLHDCLDDIVNVKRRHSMGCTTIANEFIRNILVKYMLNECKRSLKIVHDLLNDYKVKEYMDIYAILNSKERLLISFLLLRVYRAEHACYQYVRPLSLFDMCISNLLTRSIHDSRVYVYVCSRLPTLLTEHFKSQHVSNMKYARMCKSRASIVFDELRKDTTTTLCKIVCDQIIESWRGNWRTRDLTNI